MWSVSFSNMRCGWQHSASLYIYNHFQPDSEFLFPITHALAFLVYYYHPVGPIVYQYARYSFYSTSRPLFCISCLRAFRNSQYFARWQCCSASTPYLWAHDALHRGSTGCGLSSERPRKRPAVGSGSTTESIPVKQIRTDRLVTTVSSLTTPVAAAAASMFRASSCKVQPVLVQPLYHPSAAPFSFFSVGTRLRSVPTFIASFAFVAPTHPSTAGVAPSSVLWSTISNNHVALIDIAIPLRPLSRVVNHRVASAFATAASHASVILLPITFQDN